MVADAPLESRVCVERRGRMDQVLIRAEVGGPSSGHLTWKRPYSIKGGIADSLDQRLLSFRLRILGPEPLIGQS